MAGSPSREASRATGLARNDTVEVIVCRQRLEHNRTATSIVKKTVSHKH